MLTLDLFVLYNGLIIKDVDEFPLFNLLELQYYVLHSTVITHIFAT